MKSATGFEEPYTSKQIKFAPQISLGAKKVEKFWAALRSKDVMCGKLIF